MRLRRDGSIRPGSSEPRWLTASTQPVTAWASDGYRARCCRPERCGIGESQPPHSAICTWTRASPRTRLGEPSAWIASVSRGFYASMASRCLLGEPDVRGGGRALFSASARELLTDLYIRERRSTAEIGNLFHTSGTTVRRLLREQGIRVRTTGGANREDRTTPRIDLIEKLYLQGGLSAAEVARKVGCSSRIVLRLIHDMGWPVRVGGRALRHGPEDIELICALYSDNLVAAALLRHGIARVRTGRTDLATVPIAIDSHASDGSRVVRHLWSLNSPDRVVDRPAVRHRRVAASRDRCSVAPEGWTVPISQEMAS